MKGDHFHHQIEDDSQGQAGAPYNGDVRVRDRLEHV